MTDNQGGKISQTPATLAIRRRYLWFLTLHHDCECTVKTARHIWNFNHTLRSGSHELCIETLLKLIQAQGGADHVQSWREIAKKLGFEPNKATSVTFRLKKWVYENHIHEFLEKEVNSSHCLPKAQHSY
ncbi:hypothetical protein EDD86DRAFT_275804 [Gorgonomyces haynaldii]|nr:hypothetical protein EDD86DRAFT_275804 [Gorgonomyces haynaldii]